MLRRVRANTRTSAACHTTIATIAATAAAIIVRGVERGKARILVGPDAYVFDALGRIAPTHYYDTISWAESRLRRRARARTSVPRESVR